MSIRIVISLLVVTFVASPLYAQNRSQQGAVAGGIAGAILGGIAGHQNDETPEGIAIGGAVGAIAGGLLGRSQDDQMVRDYQIQQQRAFQNQQRIQAAVSVQDVITLAQTGVSDSLIINQMRNNGVRQKIGVNEIITLHRNGVSELVINEMQKLGTSTGSTVSVAATRRSNEYRRPVVIQQTPVIYEQPIVIPRPLYGPSIGVKYYKPHGSYPRSTYRPPNHYRR